MGAEVAGRRVIDRIRTGDRPRPRSAANLPAKGTEREPRFDFGVV
jgi:hypothetical protein